MAFGGEHGKSRSRPELSLEKPHSPSRTPDTAQPTQENTSTESSKDAASSSILSEDPFRNEMSKQLFDAIDQLRECGAGQDLGLPQLVIMGKQSAGKSSLLESLTDIPFPVGGGLCTRFATRIISRRTAPGTPDLINVSIERGDLDLFGDSKDDGQIGNFNPSITSMTAAAFDDVVKQASKAMKISNVTGKNSHNFSSKVLKIELSGPNRSHFGILDLPGIFDIGLGSITKEDMDGVEKMVVSYMKEPQNIIICVADAVDNLATQRIFALAKENVQNERIVGVFTKCDRTQHPADIVQLVRDNVDIDRKPLQHGWFVVRNRGPQDDPSSFDRDMTEKALFGKEPWRRIPQGRVGTENLKSTLSTLLCQRIREGFPKMQQTVQTLLETEIDNLYALGESRPDFESQKEFLINVSQRFQILTNQALRSPGDLPSYDMKLRGSIERAKRTFAIDLKRNGHLYNFSEIKVTEANPQLEDPARSRSGSKSTESSSPDDQQGRTLYDEIRTQIFANRGEELPGMINPAVMKPLLKTQTSKWEKIAVEHLDKMTTMAQNAAFSMLKWACDECRAPDHTYEQLQNVIGQLAGEAHKTSLTRLKTRCYEETSFHPQTDNQLFLTNVKKAQKLRFKAATERYRALFPASGFIVSLVDGDPERLANIPDLWKKWTVVSPESIDTLFKEMHLNSSPNTEDEIHDILKAYYEVAREDFISYVNKHIAESFLQDSAGVLLGLSREYIRGLDREEIEYLGSEDDSTVRGRKMSKAKIERLKAAKKIAEQALRRARVESSGDPVL